MLSVPILIFYKWDEEEKKNMVFSTDKEFNLTIVCALFHFLNVGFSQNDSRSLLNLSN